MEKTTRGYYIDLEKSEHRVSILDHELIFPTRKQLETFEKQYNKRIERLKEFRYYVASWTGGAIVYKDETVLLNLYAEYMEKHQRKIAKYIK